MGFSVSNGLSLEINVGTRRIRFSGGFGIPLGLDGSFHGGLVLFLVKDHHHHQGGGTLLSLVEKLFPRPYQVAVQIIGRQVLPQPVQPSHGIFHQDGTLFGGIFRHVQFGMGHKVPHAIMKAQ